MREVLWMLQQVGPLFRVGSNESTNQIIKNAVPKRHWDKGKREENGWSK